MCGIAGLLGKGSAGLAAALGGAISHRGPDRGDSFVDQEGGLTFAHRRLSIQDLSSAGDQPMADASGRYVICYNGEIYNHHDLRPDLERAGVSFRGHSDTETIVEAFARRGVSIFAELNGIFAGAIWDRRDRVLTLVRDGAGVKPLYYADTPDGFAFASEIKAMLALPSLDRSLDPVALRAYLTYLFSPGERTPLKAVRKLLPGHWLQIRADGSRTGGQFYRLPEYQPDETIDEARAISGTRDALARAVERQMLSDVEVGAFLSGGLDSSSVVHFARDHAKGKLQCFTIGYRERPDEAGELIPDLPYARKAAKHLGVDLHEVEVSSAMANDLESLVYMLDEPQADPAALNNYYISALARQHGIKVLLGGAGGDDIFTGYRRHRVAAADGWLGALPGWSRDGMAKAARRLPNGSTYGRWAQKMTASLRGGADERLMRSQEWLDIEAADRLFATPLADARALVQAPMQAVLDANRGPPPVERMLRLDQSFFLVDLNLNYTDKTGMAASVEIRVPFLDPDLMQWAAQLPTRYKIRGKLTKWALRKAMEGRLPDDVIYRPKTGFGVPLRTWMRVELKEMLESLTSRDTIEARGLFDAGAVAQLRHNTEAGRIDGSYSLLAVMVIELWHRRFVDSPMGADFTAFAKAI